MVTLLKKAMRTEGIPTTYEALIRWIQGQLEADQAYTAAVTREGEIKARIAELDARKSKLLAGLNATIHARALQERAETFLRDDVIPLPDDLEKARTRQDYASVTDEWRVLTSALELHKEVLVREQNRASAALCATLRAHHRDIVRRLAEALRALDAAATHEEDLRMALRDSGVTFLPYLRPVPPPGRPGLVRDEWSNMALWFKEAAEYGLLD